MVHHRCRRGSFAPFLLLRHQRLAWDAEALDDLGPEVAAVGAALAVDRLERQRPLKLVIKLLPLKRPDLTLW